jgi:GNAT superfamily N-acetyltransferase
MLEMNPVDLIRLSIEIEHIIDSNGDLVPIPGKESALFSISQYQEGYATYFRYDIPAETREQIAAFGPEEALNNHQTIRRVLACYTPCKEVFAGRGCYFTHIPAPDEFPDVVFHKGCYVIKVKGQPVSWAWTQDESERAAELAVETLPGYRRRGYGRQVVAAWAVDVIRGGQVAFYSHRIGNVASEGLAHSLGVVQYAVSTAYS